MVLVAAVAMLSGCTIGGESDGNATTTLEPSDERVIAQSEITPTAVDHTRVSSTPPFFIATPRDDTPVKKQVPTGPAAPTQLSPTIVDSPLDADGDGFYTFDELKQAVTQLLPSYDWPEHYQVTPDLMLSDFARMADQGATWQIPYEYTLVGLYHQCAWEHAWLDAYRTSDAATMDKSVEQLRTVALENPNMDPTYKNYLERLIDSAELGDPTIIQQGLDGTCGSYAFITPTPDASSQTSTRAGRFAHPQ